MITVKRKSVMFISFVHLALDLLFQFRKGPTTLLSGVWPTIDYLQNLSVDDMSLILKYSDWVLRDSPEEGIKVGIHVHCTCSWNNMMPSY